MEEENYYLFLALSASADPATLKNGRAGPASADPAPFKNRKAEKRRG